MATFVDKHIYELPWPYQHELRPAVSATHLYITACDSMSFKNRILPVFSLLCTLVFSTNATDAFVNTGIARVIELEGALVYSRTTYAIKALGQSNTYKIVLGEDEHVKTSFIEARVKGDQKPLELRSPGLNSRKYVL